MDGDGNEAVEEQGGQVQQQHDPPHVAPPAPRVFVARGLCGICHQPNREGEVLATCCGAAYLQLHKDTAEADGTLTQEHCDNLSQAHPGPAGGNCSSIGGRAGYRFHQRCLHRNAGLAFSHKLHNFNWGPRGKVHGVKEFRLYDVRHHACDPCLMAVYGELTVKHSGATGGKRHRCSCKHRRVCVPCRCAKDTCTMDNASHVLAVPPSPQAFTCAQLDMLPACGCLWAHPP